MGWHMAHLWAMLGIRQSLSHREDLCFLVCEVKTMVRLLLQCFFMRIKWCMVIRELCKR